MKTSLLSLLLSISFYYLSAQDIQLQTGNTNSSQSTTAYQKATLGQLIWEEDFNREKWQSTVVGDTLGYLLDTNAILPTGWKFVDSTGNDFYWHWSDVGPRGRYTSGNPDNLQASFVPNNDLLDRLPESTSVGNGFMLLESDFFNTDSMGEMVTDPIDMDTYFEYGPIDFSSYKSVIFNCKILDRLCCRGKSMVGLSVSNDFKPDYNFAGHWINYNLNIYQISSSTHIDQMDFFINVSEGVAGRDSVYFRIGKKYASHYFAIIDNVKFYEGLKNDIKVTNAWADYISSSNSADNYIGGYTMLPKDAVSSFKQFRAAVSNEGTNAAENSQLEIKLFKDAELLDSLVSESKTLQPNEKDTFIIATDFSPSNIGQYQVSMTVHADFVDEIPKNNAWGYEFETTKNTFSRVRHGKEKEFNNASARDWYGGGYDGDILLVRYDFEQDDYVLFSGIKVFIYPTTDQGELAAIENGKFKLKAVAFKKSEGGGMLEIGLESGFYTLKTEDLGKWIYLEFSNELNFKQNKGIYFLGIEQYTGTEAELQLRIGSDEYSARQPMGSNVVYFTIDSTFHTVSKNYAIDLVLSDIDTVTPKTSSDLYNSVDIYPNPFNNYLTIEDMVGVKQIQILNSTGLVVKEIEVVSEKEIIATDDLNTGLYLIVVTYTNAIRKSTPMIKK